MITILITDTSVIFILFRMIGIILEVWMGFIADDKDNVGRNLVRRLHHQNYIVMIMFGHQQWWWKSLGNIVILMMYHYMMVIYQMIHNNYTHFECQWWYQKRMIDMIPMIKLTWSPSLWKVIFVPDFHPGFTLIVNTWSWSRSWWWSWLLTWWWFWWWSWWPVW